jgi:hypothetical protein
MEAEMIRDVSLAASGLLSRTVGGPSVFPPQPDGIWDNPYSNARWVTSTGEDRYRRGLYTFIRRTSPYPSLMTFDATSREVCTVRRVRTNTPLQALATMNDEAFFEAARALASRMLSEVTALTDSDSDSDSDSDRVGQGFSPADHAKPEGFSPADHAKPEGFSPADHAKPEGFSPADHAKPEGFSPADHAKPEGFSPADHAKPEGFSPADHAKPQGFSPASDSNVGQRFSRTEETEARPLLTVSRAEALPHADGAEPAAVRRARAAYGFRLCTSRTPTDAEIDRIVQAYASQLEAFTGDPENARLVAGAGAEADAAERAAWTIIANALLNLDETVTK